FGTLVAALLPLAIGALSVVGTFLVLLVVNEFTEVSVFALNLTTAMGLGLAIDYSLFMVSRFREELHAGHAPPEAVRRTVQTAGRTVLFSALTVAAALSAMLVFDVAFLRSFAYAGLAVSALAGVYAVVVLPAIMAALGHRINSLAIRKRATVPTDEGVWHRIAVAVMSRPVPIAAGVMVLLLFLGAPFRNLELGMPDDRVLPPASPTRAVQDEIRNDFASEEAGAVAIVISGLAAAPDRGAGIGEYALALATLPDVTRVDAETGIYCGSTGAVGGFPCQPGQLLVGPEANAGLATRFSRPDATYLSVVPDVEPLSPSGEALAEAVRDLAPPAALGAAEVRVGGQSAIFVDSKASLFGDLPLAIGLIAAITFVLLFLMFGSVVVPAKALILNLLSLSATFGAMVWVFQEGNGSGLL
ncbi:MAG TPA: MMPL family transporter, partial [Acidimicrobiales bacterium]|nr:MMPL family transporter [Acidimicrobiales bacterium]